MYIIVLDGDCKYDSWKKKLQDVAAIGYMDFDDALQALEDCGITPDVEDDRITIWRYDYEYRAEPVWEFRGWHFSDEHGLEQGALLGHDDSWYEELMEDY